MEAKYLILTERNCMAQDYKIFIDTNVLVYASLIDFETAKNKEAINTLNRLRKEKSELYISTQILREFYAVVTNKKYLQNPLTPKQANEQIKFFISAFNMLSVSDTIFPFLALISEKYNIIGQQIHDAAIAATMLAHNIKTIFTFNIKDFKHIKEIKLLNL